MKKLLVPLVIGIILFTNLAFAQGNQPYIEILTPQVRERNSMVGNLLGWDKEVEVYMGIYIESGYQKSDALIAVDSELAESYGFFKRFDSGRAMLEVTEMSFIPLAEYKDTNLSYIGPHIRLSGVEYMPKPGENFPITLIFREAGRVSVKARVLDPKTGL